MIRVHLIHGLEGSPNGRKRRALNCFAVDCPSMDTSDFAGCVELHAARIAETSPDLIVGSSFGGAVACELMTRGWRGPVLLLAPAWRKYVGSVLTSGDFTVVHGMHDDVIPFADSVELAARHGAPLVPVNDGHRLAAWTESGALVALVHHLWSLAQLGSGGGS